MRPSRYNLIDTIKEEDTIRTEGESFISYTGHNKTGGNKMLKQLQRQSILEEEEEVPSLFGIRKMVDKSGISSASGFSAT